MGSWTLLNKLSHSLATLTSSAGQTGLLLIGKKFSDGDTFARSMNMFYRAMHYSA